MRKLYVRKSKTAPKPGWVEAPKPSVAQPHKSFVRYEDAVFYRTGILSHDGHYLYDEYNEEALRGTALWPEGCNRQYITNLAGLSPERTDDIPVWFGEATSDRVLYQFIYFGWVRGVITVGMLPANFMPNGGSIVSVAERPQRNCKFNRCEVFRPRWNHLYVGSGYR